MGRGSFPRANVLIVTGTRRSLRISHLIFKLRKVFRTITRSNLKEKETFITMPFLEMLLFESESPKMPNLSEKEMIYTLN